MAVADALVFVRLLDQRSNKLRYLAGLIFAPTLAERRLVRLPSSLVFLYYPLRPLRLTTRWAARLVSAACLAMVSLIQALALLGRGSSRRIGPRKGDT